jgi:hypothetical protein
MSGPGEQNSRDRTGSRSTFAHGPERESRESACATEALEG